MLGIAWLKSNHVFRKSKTLSIKKENYYSHKMTLKTQIIMTILKQKNNPLIKELNSLYKNLCYYIKNVKNIKTAINLNLIKIKIKIKNDK